MACCRIWQARGFSSSWASTRLPAAPSPSSSSSPFSSSTSAATLPRWRPSRPSLCQSVRAANRHARTQLTVGGCTGVAPTNVTNPLPASFHRCRERAAPPRPTLRCYLHHRGSPTGNWLIARCSPSCLLRSHPRDHLQRVPRPSQPDRRRDQPRLSLIRVHLFRMHHPPHDRLRLLHRCAAHGRPHRGQGHPAGLIPPPCRQWLLGVFATRRQLRSLAAYETACFPTGHTLGPRDSLSVSVRAEKDTRATSLPGASSSILLLSAQGPRYTAPLRFEHRTDAALPHTQLVRRARSCKLWSGCAYLF
jgi:hypothetical protein